MQWRARAGAVLLYMAKHNQPSTHVRPSIRDIRDRHMGGGTATVLYGALPADPRRWCSHLSSAAAQDSSIILTSRPSSSVVSPSILSPQSSVVSRHSPSSNSTKALPAPLPLLDPYPVSWHFLHSQVSSPRLTSHPRFPFLSSSDRLLPCSVRIVWSDRYWKALHVDRAVIFTPGG
jgi:hypothetical protein